MADQGLSGRIGVYGRADAGASYALLRRLQEANPAVELVGEYGDSLFTEARETKDAPELA